MQSSRTEEKTKQRRCMARTAAAHSCCSQQSAQHSSCDIASRAGPCPCPDGATSFKGHRWKPSRSTGFVDCQRATGVNCVKSASLCGHGDADFLTLCLGDWAADGAPTTGIVILVGRPLAIAAPWWWRRRRCMHSRKPLLFSGNTAAAHHLCLTRGAAVVGPKEPAVLRLHRRACRRRRHRCGPHCSFSLGSGTNDLPWPGHRADCRQELGLECGEDRCVF